MEASESTVGYFSSRGRAGFPPLSDTMEAKVRLWLREVKVGLREVAQQWRHRRAHQIILLSLDWFQGESTGRKVFLPPNISGVPVDCPKKTFQILNFSNIAGVPNPQILVSWLWDSQFLDCYPLGINLYSYLRNDPMALSDCPATPESTLRSDFPHCKFKGIPHFQSHIDDSLVPFCMVK